MLLDWCIGKAASPVKEFYLLPVGVSLYNMIPLRSIQSSRTRRERQPLHVRTGICLRAVWKSALQPSSTQNSGIERSAGGMEIY